MLDIDFFKKINDVFGHAIGDEALKKTSNLIQESLRRGDISARLGGEEFAILLPETSAKDSVVLAERLCKGISCIELTVPDGAYQFTVSIGITGDNSANNTLDNLLAKADEALYEAKESGRNRIVLR